VIRSVTRKLFGGLRRSNEDLLRDVRLIACDLDGTLLNRDDMIGPSTAEMIRMIEESGVRFLVITRRHHQSVEPYIDLVGLQSPVISLDGALIRPPHSGKLIHTIPFDQAFAADILDESRLTDGVSWCAVTPDVFYFSHEDVTLPTYHVHWNIETEVAGESLETIREPILEIIVCGGYYGVNGIYSYVQEKMEPGELKLRMYESYSKSDLWYLEVRSAHATKENALAWLVEREGVPMETVVGIGDHYNDVEFCRRAGYVVAMRNAVADLKEIADFVTARECVDDGINEFLAHFLKLRGIDYNVPNTPRLDARPRSR
jgi:Cof subfamily protein (haloacid dehalogenase superfamily)